MNDAIFYAAAAMGRKLRGQALVARDGFSARYDLDRIKGVFSRPEHKLAGESYLGRVLVLDAAKGGVATAWMLHEMAARDMMPAALVLNTVNPIMVQGAALAGATLISGFDRDITAVIPSGAEVEIDPLAERPYIRILGATPAREPWSPTAAASPGPWYYRCAVPLAPRTCLPAAAAAAIRNGTESRLTVT